MTNQEFLNNCDEIIKMHLQSIAYQKKTVERLAGSQIYGFRLLAKWARENIEFDKQSIKYWIEIKKLRSTKVCGICNQLLTREELITGHCFNCGEQDL